MHCGVSSGLIEFVAAIDDAGIRKIKNRWRDTETRVLSDSQVESYFRYQDQPQLKQAEIELISSHLERSVKI
jgi:hypothetical protein